MKNKGELNKLGTIIVLAMIILIGLSFTISVANTKQLSTEKINLVNEAISISMARDNSADINTTYPFTITNYPTGWKTTDCPISSVTYGNATNDYTLTTDYTFTASTGVLLLKNTSAVKTGGNATLIDYTYCDDGYMTNSGDRSLAGLWTTLMIMVLLITAALVGYKVMNER